MALHVRYIFWYVSLLYLRKTKSVSARTDVKNNSVSHFQPELFKEESLININVLCYLNVSQSS